MISSLIDAWEKLFMVFGTPAIILAICGLVVHSNTPDNGVVWLMIAPLAVIVATGMPIAILMWLEYLRDEVL